LLGQGAQMNPKAMPAAAQLLAGPPIPDRFRGRCQTKRDTLVLQVGGWAWDWRPHPAKIRCHETSHKVFIQEL
jgi:hypothetical protein